MAAFVIVMFLLGPVTALVLSVGTVVVAVDEVYMVFQRAGYRPATLVGVVATVATMVGSYYFGLGALPLAVALTVLCSLAWYLIGVSRARPTVNVSLTLLGFGWVGFMGSFGSLLLSRSAFPAGNGTGLLFGALLTAMCYDIGGLVGGKTFGRRQLAPKVSPQKTWAGLAGGTVVALLVAGVLVSRLHPWSLTSSLVLGLVVAVLAPIGDLAESLVKRDLGVKDMGSLLPGHGGVLDRIDSLLFVLPATYYLAVAFHLT